MAVWAKSIKHQFLVPIGIRHLTVGSWVVGMLRCSLLFTLLAVLAWWAFDFRVLAAGGGAVGLFLFGCFLNAWIVGVFVCALITLFGNRAEAFAWASVNLVLVLAGIYYPFSVLPEPAATLARALPLTYFLDAYRSHFVFASAFAAPIATGLALSVVCAVVAHLGFSASVPRARRTGLLLQMLE